METGCVGDMVKTALITFHRDETDILSDWLHWHSELFGAENIFFIDHDSQEPTCQRLISDYEAGGMRVRKFSGQFKDKAKQLSQWMNEIKDAYDILMPIDADEFIACSQDGKAFSTERQEIYDALPSPENPIWKFHVFTAKCPEHIERDPILETDAFVCGGFQKVFYSAKTFTETDQGNHGWGRDGQQSNLALVHYHLRGLEHFQAKTHRNLNAYGCQHYFAPQVWGMLYIRYRIGIAANKLEQTYRHSSDHFGKTVFRCQPDFSGR